MIDEARTLLSDIQDTIVHLDNMLAEKNDMIDLLSHDLRSPVNRILALSNLVKIDDETKKEIYADYIAEECKSLLSVLENILLMMKEDSRPFKLGQVNLSELIEETVRYNKFDLTQNFNDTVNQTAAGGTMPPAAFLCPSYGEKKSGISAAYCSGPSAFTTGVTCYLGVRGTANDYVAAKRGVFGMQSVNSVTQAATTKIKDILDGTSKTFMFGEFRPDSQIVVGQSTTIDPDSRWSPWSLGYVLEGSGSTKTMIYGPNQIAGFTHYNQWANHSFSSWHNGGLHMVRADASAGFVSDTIDITIWRNLATIAGSETNTIFE